MDLIRELIWKLRRKKYVLIHFNDKEATLEGFLIGFWSGHYVLRVSKIVEEGDQTHVLDGEVLVPRANVFFIQRVAENTTTL